MKSKEASTSSVVLVSIVVDSRVDGSQPDTWSINCCCEKLAQQAPSSNTIDVVSPPTLKVHLLDGDGILT